MAANPTFFVDEHVVGTGTFQSAVKVAMNRVAQETKALSYQRATTSCGPGGLHRAGTFKTGRRGWSR